eukprot:Hpha_TRINITY_DN15641_c0_g1::TRINITY_DN15641_c0_g1_i16::g.98195::m.98195
MRPPPTDSESDSTIEDPLLIPRICWPGMGPGGEAAPAVAGQARVPLPSSDDKGGEEGVDACVAQPAAAAARVRMPIDDGRSDRQASDTVEPAVLRMTWREEGSAPKRRRLDGEAAAAEPQASVEAEEVGGVGVAVEVRGTLSVDAGHRIPWSLGGQVIMPAGGVSAEPPPGR